MDEIKYLRISACTQCNVTCWYCFNEGLDFGKSYIQDMDAFRWVVGFIVKNYSTEIIRFTGGEPLLNPHIIDMVKITNEMGVKKIGFTTNGVLLPQFADKLNQNGISEYAVHIYQIDNGEPVLDEVFSFIESIRILTKNVRFNIVVTRRSIDLVREILRYSVDNDVNLLLLDLLKASSSETVFAKTYYPLEECKQVLLACGYNEKVEAANAVVYRGARSSIKVVNHYADPQSHCVFCTRTVPTHPILLTPDFELAICTHFGKKAFSLAEAMQTRDEQKLRDVITETLAYLYSCEECPRKQIL